MKQKKNGKKKLSCQLFSHGNVRKTCAAFARSRKDNHMENAQLSTELWERIVVNEMTHCTILFFFLGRYARSFEYFSSVHYNWITGYFSFLFSLLLSSL